LTFAAIEAFIDNVATAGEVAEGDGPCAAAPPPPDGGHLLADTIAGLH
jgi:hypothetical protein